EWHTEWWRNGVSGIGIQYSKGIRMDAGTAKKLIEKNLSCEEAKRLAVKLVQHPSPQTSLLEKEPQVLALIREVVKPELEASGLKPMIDDLGNLILHIKGRGRSERLILVGYAMCAAPSTMQNPYSGNVQADWCVIDGPPEIQLGNKGRVDLLFTVRGKQAHSSRPWEGINSIDGAMKVLQKLQPLMPYPETRSHAELGKVSLTPNAIESFPKATHTIQSECRILFDRRLLPGDDPARAIRQMKDTIGEIDPFEIAVEPRDFMYP